jgi:hypothetical protein
MTALKKRKSVVEEEEFDEVETEEDDLFASSSAPVIRDASAHLQPLLSTISTIMALPTDERVSAFSQVRVGVLRRIVQLYPGEEIDGLKGVLRSWRSLGGRVTRKTTEELVGRLCHLNKVDLAVELINDRTQCTSTPTHLSVRLTTRRSTPTPNSHPIPPPSSSPPIPYTYPNRLITRNTSIQNTRYFTTCTHAENETRTSFA